jgi:hypothetical protein
VENGQVSSWSWGKTYHWSKAAIELSGTAHPVVIMFLPLDDCHAVAIRVGDQLLAIDF